MINDKKDRQPQPPSEPNDASGAGDPAWDEDFGASTLTTNGPTFALPKDIPSPIADGPAVVRAPALAPPAQRVVKKVGAAAPGPWLPRSSAPILAAPAKKESAEKQEWDRADEGHEDEPTKPVPAAANPTGAVRDGGAMRRPPLAGKPSAGKGGDAKALRAKQVVLPRLDREETTRPVSRAELMGHQDASVVVGDDAVGDEETMEVAIGHVARFGPGPARVPGRPAADPPQNKVAVGSSGRLPAPEPQAQGQQPAATGTLQLGMPHGGAPQGAMAQPGAAQAAPWRAEAAPPPNRAPSPIGAAAFDPGVPPAPQSSPGLGQAPQAGSGTGPMQAGPGMPWMLKADVPPLTTRKSRFPAQLILLVVVGIVCLSIFITGVVLFVTTKQ